MVAVTPKAKVRGGVALPPSHSSPVAADAPPRRSFAAKMGAIFPAATIVVATFNILSSEHFIGMHPHPANHARSALRLRSRFVRSRAAGDDPPSRPPPPELLEPIGASRLSSLPREELPHGTFHFGPDSSMLRFVAPPAHMMGRRWKGGPLDDMDVNVERERERCRSYNFDFPKVEGGVPPKRRRLFLGSLIADDSIEVLSAVGMEAFNIYHTVAFVEGNNTINMERSRKWTYLDDDDRPSSERLYRLYQLFGQRTRVSVDYYTTERTIEHGKGRWGVLHEALQRDGILHRWRRNGMTGEDVGVIADTDETFTRDFLRALQICDIPHFRPGQDCREPKVYSSGYIYEGSPDCVNNERRWHHPDATLGECVDLIGDTAVHPPGRREWTPDNYATSYGHREEGWGRERNYSFFKENEFPLWNAEDIRIEMGGKGQIMKNDKYQSPTGFHFHNFFDNLNAIHYKYWTYGHSLRSAISKPIWETSPDLEVGVRCAKGERSMGWHGSARWSTRSFNSTAGSSQPIYYQDWDRFKGRDSEWKRIIDEEEQIYGAYPIKTPPKVNPDKFAKDLKDTKETREKGLKRIVDFLYPEGKKKSDRKVPVMQSNWDSSKSAVLALATNLDLRSCKQFAGSLRATGYPGHIIIGIAQNMPQEVLSCLEDYKVTTKVVEMATTCTYNGTVGYYGGHDGAILDTKDWHCPKAYPDYKITWARFLLYKDWLNECPECTDGIIVTDARDVYWQRDPFLTAERLGMEHPLMVFEEIYPALDNTHWLTDFPVKKCKSFDLKATPMLCSGSVMGSREGIIGMVNALEEEYKLWMKDEKCRIDMIGDDQSVHNYMFYAGKLEGAVAIPNRMGPLHVVGWIANKMWRTAEEQAKREGTRPDDFYVEGQYQEWLPKEFEFIDPETGLILNEDGSPSAQLHQVDRFGTLNRRWLHMMEASDWPYNKDQRTAK